MSEFNVLGASDRNKRAIQLALTIPGSKTLAGSASPDLKFTEDEEKVQPFVHPFKMSIIDNEGTKYLNIHEGKITISNNSTDRTWVAYFDQDALGLSEISTSGEYYVILAIKYDPTGTGDDHDNTSFPCNVYFVNSDVTTNLVPGTRGFQTITIGKVKAQVIDNQMIYSISRQDLTSDLFLEFNSLNHPFSITANSDEFEDGSIKNTYSLSDFEFHVKGGTAIIKNVEYTVSAQDFTINQNTYIYCTINENTPSACIITSSSRLQYFDPQNQIYNHCIGYISYNSQTFGLKIDQYIHDTIGSAGSDTYKVKTIEDDEQPDYLSSKFIFDAASQSHPLNGYDATLIGAQCVSSQVTQQGLSGLQYKIKPIWMWQNIDGYDQSKGQYLTNDEGTLRWKPGGLEVSGSLANFEEIKEVAGKNILRWKPEFDTSTNFDPFYFLASAKRRRSWS